MVILSVPFSALQPERIVVPSVIASRAEHFMLSQVFIEPHAQPRGFSFRQAGGARRLVARVVAKTSPEVRASQKYGIRGRTASLPSHKTPSPHYHAAALRPGVIGRGRGVCEPEQGELGSRLKVPALGGREDAGEMTYLSAPRTGSASSPLNLLNRSVL